MDPFFKHLDDIRSALRVLPGITPRHDIIFLRFCFLFIAKGEIQMTILF